MNEKELLEELRSALKHGIKESTLKILIKREIERLIQDIKSIQEQEVIEQVDKEWYDGQY